eukprot:scaffold10917_cov155-Amphora_coffeaeformis.AAC.13
MDGICCYGQVQLSSTVRLLSLWDDNMVDDLNGQTAVNDADHAFLLRIHEQQQKVAIISSSCASALGISQPRKLCNFWLGVPFEF